MSDENIKDNQYPFHIDDQYVKDFSFENPKYLLKFSEEKVQPEVTVGVETGVSKFDNEHFEVTLGINAKSHSGDETLFLVELAYACLVSVKKDIERDMLEPILLVHCPFLIFPFARELIANITRSGGYPPLALEPIDFATLYLKKKEEAKRNRESAN